MRPRALQLLMKVLVCAILAACLLATLRLHLGTGPRGQPGLNTDPQLTEAATALGGPHSSEAEDVLADAGSASTPYLDAALSRALADDNNLRSAVLNAIVRVCRALGKVGAHWLFSRAVAEQRSRSPRVGPVFYLLPLASVPGADEVYLEGLSSNDPAVLTVSLDGIKDANKLSQPPGKGIAPNDRAAIQSAVARLGRNRKDLKELTQRCLLSFKPQNQSHGRPHRIRKPQPGGRHVQTETGR